MFILNNFQTYRKGIYRKESVPLSFLFMNAVLYNKHKRALGVTIENGSVIEIGEVLDQNALPLCLQTKLTLETINKWLDKRKMPLNREGLKTVKTLFGSSYYQNYTHMFSLTDQYWFKISQNDSWRKLNFFTNKYSSAIGQSLFCPWEINEEDLKMESPDLTTNGVLRKVWVQDDSLNSSLVKAGSQKFLQEPLSEILATIVMDKIKIIPFVRYDVCVYGMRICSKCANFVTENTEFIPAQSIYDTEPRRTDTSQYQHMINRMEAFGVEHPMDFMDKMILCDWIMGNTDRHLGNFGVLKDVTNGQILGFAPLFDFGSAFHEYSLKPVKDEKPRLFGDELSRIIRVYGKSLNLRALADTTDMFQIINTYPGLTTEQKNAVKEGIEKRMKRFDVQDSIRGGARSR